MHSLEIKVLLDLINHLVLQYKTNLSVIGSVHLLMIYTDFNNVTIADIKNHIHVDLMMSEFIAAIRFPYI